MNETFWSGKSALISGASSGLGRQLALDLAKQKAHIYLVGRDVARLDLTKKEAEASGSPSVTCISTDVLAPNLESTIKSSLGLRTNLDLLINAVGRSDRGLLLQLSSQELIDQFEINVIASHAMTKACHPFLKNAKGCVVNVGSLASKVAAPGLGGYAISKFGLAAMSQQLRLEVKEEGIHVLLVCPGPIERDDAGSRYDNLAQERGLDDRLRKPAGGVKLKSLSIEELSRDILRAAANRSFELINPGKVRWLSAIAALWPGIGDWILRRSMSKVAK